MPTLPSAFLPRLYVLGAIGEALPLPSTSRKRPTVLAGAEPVADNSNSSTDPPGQRLRAEFQKGLLYNGETPAELIARRPGTEALPELQLAEDEVFFDRSVRFYTELAGVEPARAWRQVWQPVLALHGEYDWTSARADHEQIARLTGGKFQSLPGMDQGFLSYESLSESYAARGTGEFDEEIVKATLAWMATLVTTPPTAEP